MTSRRDEKINQVGAMRARQVRGLLGLGRGPVADMFALVENEGIFLVRAPGGDVGLHAFFAVIGGDHVIFVNSGETLGRQIFSVAHEYCHYLFDRGLRHEVHCNPGTSTKDQSEICADAFAAEFLLPRDGVHQEYLKRFGAARPTEREVIKMMHTFRVSYHAMALSIYDAGLFTSATEYRRVKELCSLKNKDILQDTILKLGFELDMVRPTDPHCPQRFLEAVVDNYEDGLITYSKLRSLLEPWNKTPEELGVGEDRPM